MISVSTVELVSPPITVIDNGLHRFDPSCVLIAIGKRPRSVAIVVMSIGRRRPIPASHADVSGSIPCWRLVRAKLTTRTEFAVATPRLMIAPIKAGTLKVVNVR